MKTLLALTTATVALAFLASTASAEGDADILFVSSATAKVGDEVTVTLGVSKTVGAPSDAWSIDISYDNAILSAVDCEPLHGSVCSPAFMDNAFRATGASPDAIEAPMDFARLTFRCGRAGVSPLNMEVGAWADATGFGEEIDLNEGSITCTDPGLVRLGNYTTTVGDEVLAVLEAGDIAEPGIGAWTLDVGYNLSVVTPRSCTARFRGVCNVAFSEDEVRVAGASASGLSGDFVLAEVEFSCLKPGVTPLILTRSVFGSGIPEDSYESDVMNGSITCTEPMSPAQLPPTGSASPHHTSTSAAALVALLGVSLLTIAMATRLRSASN